MNLTAKLRDLAPDLLTDGYRDSAIAVKRAADVIEKLTEEHDALRAQLQQYNKALREQKPVAWIRGDHLLMITQRRPGAQSMRAALSTEKLQPDYVALYVYPAADAADAEELLESITAAPEYKP